MKKLLWIPLITLSYSIFSYVFDLPLIEVVVGLLSGVQILIIMLATFATKYDGIVQVEIDPGGVKRASLVIDGDPETLLETKNELLFKVQKDET